LLFGQIHTSGNRNEKWEEKETGTNSRKKKWKLSCHKADIQEASGSRPE